MENNKQAHKKLHRTSAAMQSHCRPGGSPTTSKWQREQTARSMKREVAKTNCHIVKTNVTIFDGGPSARCQSLKEQQSSRPRR